ncbi:MBL fold metallo-hydrolase [Pengzhenrongella frigida]|uniref:MBL fold metallo-hydrolase n=1 Tax=Pengzhenrongella frigida TaxID=1259133 RepID=A0A4Q5N7A6_9MICO|nr:MBL fold metallo-hydrolase [Cellulomonas sp. HLT2-17]RYV52341.1 MBL fold metallo-hydrolase [Cellulomonas sp. HLT2-17]
MRLTVVGCAGSFPSAVSAASSYLVEADDADGRTWRVVLDLGNGAFGPLQKYCDPNRVDAFAISHLHADHAADLVVLGVYRRYHPGGPCGPVPVHGPAGTTERLAQLAGTDPATDISGQVEVRRWDPASPVQVGPLRLEPVPMAHPVPAFGIRVTGPAEADPARRVTLAYTGDTDACAGLDALATGADLLLSEAGFLEGRDDAVRGVHLTGRRAGQAATAARSGRLVLTHVPAWNDAGVTLREAQQVYAGPIDLARPGSVYLL